MKNNIIDFKLKQNTMGRTNTAVVVLNTLFGIGLCIAIVYAVGILFTTPVTAGISFASFFSWYLVIMTGIASVKAIIEGRKSELTIVIVIAIFGFIAVGLAPDIARGGGGASIFQKVLGRALILLLPTLLHCKNMTRKLVMSSVTVCIVALFITIFFERNANTCISNDVVGGDCYIEALDMSDTNPIGATTN